MCGIVGLFLKNPKLKPELGAFLSAMLTTLSDRGPDSAGFAVYGEARPEGVKLTLRGNSETDFGALSAKVGRELAQDVSVSRRDTHAVLTVPAARTAEARAQLGRIAPDVAIVGMGRRMELYKEVGRPSEVAKRFDLQGMAGTHAIGHTRMATESAVTTDGAHPYSTGADQCLVHNGSLSNHNSLRRELRRDGIGFATENDTEVAAGYLTWRLRQGMQLGAALESALADLDGFYTFVVGTESGFGVLRDPIACKPAVMAETDDYVAFGTEYRALADLPGIERARVFEPEPAKVYFWDLQQ
ncbi:MAG TPA: glutamine amidotransferase family protein [Stellaceae bacterium]|jgi:glutamate synthase domain-containing protein 1|nr:glutamine amidotransferase family protein [Stellaceae bacterium]